MARSRINGDGACTRCVSPVSSKGINAKIPDEFVKQLSQLRELRVPGVPDLTSRVRDLVFIASSSRGGSSMLAEMLRYSPDMIHLQGELNPVLRLAGLSFP